MGSADGAVIKDRKDAKDRKDDTVDPRSLARLNAVQGLYQIEMTDKSPTDVAADFHARGFAAGDEEDQISTTPDKELFEALLRAATEDGTHIDAIITGALAPGLKFERLEILMKAILRCGTGELQTFPDHPVAVVVNEYVDIANAFYEGNEPGLVNGILDAIAKTGRAPKNK